MPTKDEILSELGLGPAWRLRDFPGLAAISALVARVVTSARRWERHGIVATILLMWRLRLLYFLGADPAKLAQRYAR